jgi:hypothetical protein
MPLRWSTTGVCHALLWFPKQIVRLATVTKMLKMLGTEITTCYSGAKTLGLRRIGLGRTCLGWEWDMYGKCLWNPV